MRALLISISLMLATAACAAQTTVTLDEQALPQPVEVVPTPTPVPPTPTPLPTSTPAPLEPSDVDAAEVAVALATAQLNQPSGSHPNARFDLFVQALFEDLPRQPLAELRDAVVWRCEGASDDVVRAAGFRDAHLKRLLAVDEASCSGLAPTQLPVPTIDADGWTEALTVSYARAIPWASAEDFTTYLEQACADPGSADDELWERFSSSMRIEAVALLGNDACELTGGPRSSDDDGTGPFNPQTATDGTPIVPAYERNEGGNVRLNFWIYFIRNDPNDSTSAYDLFRTHAWRGETERLTDFRDVRGPGVEPNNVYISPDQRRVAYVVDVSSGLDRIFVSDVDNPSPVDLGWLYPDGSIFWTNDSQELLLLNEDENEIEAVSASTGTRRTVLAAPLQSEIGVIGLADNHVIHWQSDQVAGAFQRVVRRDLATGDVVAEFELTARSEIEWSRDRSRFFLIDSADGQDTRVLAVDVSEGGLDVVEVPAPDGYETDLAISPDGSRLSYASGPAPFGREIYFLNLDDPGEILHLTSGAGRGHVQGMIWSPASNAVVISYGISRRAISVIAEDGTRFDVETIGVPVALLLEEDK